MYKRLKRLSTVFIIIILGLASRQIHWVPLYFGDVLYGAMMFFIVWSLCIDLSLKKIALASLTMTYLIEFSQLYQAEWIKNLRSTTMGRLVLGQGFLWSDILAYAGGIIVSLALIKFITRSKQEY